MSMPQRCGSERDSLRSLDEQLRFAIANKHLIHLRYGGAPRIGEPHDYGIQHGIAKLLFYQLRQANGDQRWVAAAGWRMLWVSKIEARRHVRNVCRQPRIVASAASGLGRTVCPRRLLIG